MPSEKTLRSQVIKLAFQRPELRKDLLPLLKEGAGLTLPIVIEDKSPVPPLDDLINDALAAGYSPKFAKYYALRHVDRIDPKGFRQVLSKFGLSEGDLERRVVVEDIHANDENVVGQIFWIREPPVGSGIRPPLKGGLDPMRTGWFIEVLPDNPKRRAAQVQKSAANFLKYWNMVAMWDGGYVQLPPLKK